MKKEKKSEWDEFTRRIYVNAPIDKVYESWATCKGITSWFLEKAELHNEKGKKSDTDFAGKGDGYNWKWVGNPFIGHGEILRVNDKDHLEFSFVEAKTVVTIQLKEKNGRTLIELTQKHLQKKIKTRKKIYMECFAPWSYHLTNLRSILEGGIDLREQDPDVKELVNS